MSAEDMVLKKVLEKSSEKNQTLFDYIKEENTKKAWRIKKEI